jgi:hypothetical protein
MFYAINLTASVGSAEKNGIAQRTYDVNFYLQGCVTDEIDVLPNDLSLGIVDPRSVPEKQLVVEAMVSSAVLNLRPQDVTVLAQGPYRAQLECAVIRVESVAGTKNQRIFVRFCGLPQDAEGPFRGLVRIHAVRLTNGTLDVPFFGVFRAQQ